LCPLEKFQKLQMPVNPQLREGCEISRPRAWLRSIQFTTGLKLDLNPHEVVVIVGPNNSGKSVFLRELQVLLLNGPENTPGRLVVQSVHVETDSDTDQVLQWALSITPERVRSLNRQDPSLDVPQGRVSRGQIASDWGRGIGGNGFGGMALVFSTYLATDARLHLTQSVGSIDLASNSPTQPLQHLFEDEEIELRLSKLVRQAFGDELVVNRGAGSQIHLHLGKRPELLSGRDRLSKEFRHAVHDLQLVSNQGDGIKAFVGLLLHTLILDRDITLIDEPEAFLHPPQATLLGRVLATEIPAPRQLVVATHSSDILKGLLDDPRSPVRIVRIRRSGTESDVSELNPELVREAWQDPLLRYSGVFDGLFHQGVIVCESDSDCKFYGAMMNAVAGDERPPDLLLVHGGGKGRVPTIVRALHAIQVPVRAVFDFDVLSDESVLKRTVEAFGGNWTDVVSDWRIVKTAIESKRPELQTKDVREKIDQVLEAVRQETLPAESAKSIRDILRSASAWSEAKRSGKSFVPRGEQTATFERLAETLRRLGIHLVEVGELEGFCPSIGNHGPAWTVNVLERDLVNDMELATARAFARSLLANW
jgi:energy-coupling factor transporter ATP-binding protein EcfA2